MIKFEEHEGKLFLMLDKPVPLTADSNMPCLVRLIQDDSPMGRMNKRAYPIDRISPFIAVDLEQSGEISAIGNVNTHLEHESHEIIGYPVVEGSAEWALWQMQQGKRVCRKCWQDNEHDMLSNYGIDNDTVYAYLGYDKGFNPNQQGKWLYDMTEICRARDGWQLYKEPEPKPLLADAKVGDLCKHRNGDWSQIIDTNGTYIQAQPIRTTLKDTLGTNRNFCLSGSHFIMQFGGEYDIIHTEPLAPEGTAEWALQMWKLGNDIRNETGVVLMADYESEEIRVKHLVDVFPSGWQIYKEPEPAKEPIADCDNCKHRCTKSNIDYCQMYEPKPTFKVGDWVEWCGGQYMVESAPPKSDHYDIRSPYEELGCSVYPENITRKLAPSQVVIHIGCLSGTIEKSCDHSYFLMRHSSPKLDCDYSIIRFSAIDKETRKLVESLLKAQQEENNG